MIKNGVSINSSSVIWFSIAISGVLLLAGLYVCLSFGLPACEQTARMGDSIGGITAPFIGLIGSLLVFGSFLVQVNANKHLQNEINKTNFFKSYDAITDLINFTERQYENLIKPDTRKLGNLLLDVEEVVKRDDYIDKDVTETLTKYRCVLELISESSFSIAKFRRKSETNNNNENNEYDYQNQLRTRFASFYNLYYDSIVNEGSQKLQIQDIDQDIKNWYYFFGETRISIERGKDVSSFSAAEKQIYYIALAIRNIRAVLKDKNSENYKKFFDI